MDAAVGLDLGDSPPRKSNKKFNLPKFDMDLDIGGGFSTKLASFDLDFSGLSPPKEKVSQVADHAKDLSEPSAMAISPPRRTAVPKEKDSKRRLLKEKDSQITEHVGFSTSSKPSAASSNLASFDLDFSGLSPPIEKESQVTEHAKDLSEPSAMVISPPKQTAVLKGKVEWLFAVLRFYMFLQDSQRRLLKQKDSQLCERVDPSTSARNLSKLSATVPKEDVGIFPIQDSERRLLTQDSHVTEHPAGPSLPDSPPKLPKGNYSQDDPPACANSAIVLFNPVGEVTEPNTASLMDNESISKAEKYSRDLEDMCKMLKQKHDEAKNLLVKALISNNSLLMLASPMEEEKISFPQ